jgi:transcriptional regulator with XRE-family HTH domain
MDTNERLYRIKSDIEIIEEEVINTLRKLKKQRQLKKTANKIGVRLQYLSNYLNGRISISNKGLFKIAKVLFAEYRKN